MNKEIEAALFLVLSNDTYKLLAYFTLSLKALEFNESISKTAIKNIDGFNKSAVSTPVILIGQLGKDKYIGHQLKGSELLDICLSYVYQIHNLAGSRIVLVESAKIDKVMAFYKSNGFSVLQEDINGKLVQMIRTL